MSKRPGQKPRKENYISDSDSDDERKNRGGLKSNSGQSGGPPAVTVCPVPNKTIQPHGYPDEYSTTKITPQQPSCQYPAGYVTNPPGNFVPTPESTAVPVCPPGNFMPNSGHPAVQVCPVPQMYPQPGLDCGPVNSNAYPSSYPTNATSNQFGIGFTPSDNAGYPPGPPSQGWATSGDIGFQPNPTIAVGGCYPPANPGSQGSYVPNSNYMPGMPQPDTYPSGTNYYQPGGGNPNYQPGNSNYQPGVPRY